MDHAIIVLLGALFWTGVPIACVLIVVNNLLATPSRRADFACLGLLSIVALAWATSDARHAAIIEYTWFLFIASAVPLLIIGLIAFAPHRHALAWSTITHLLCMILFVRMLHILTAPEQVYDIGVPNLLALFMLPILLGAIACLFKLVRISPRSDVAAAISMIGLAGIGTAAALNERAFQALSAQPGTTYVRGAFGAGPFGVEPNGVIVAAMLVIHVVDHVYFRRHRGTSVAVNDGRK